jgi:hypothetical protein
LEAGFGELTSAHRLSAFTQSERNLFKQ